MELYKKLSKLYPPEEFLYTLVKPSFPIEESREKVGPKPVVIKHAGAIAIVGGVTCSSCKVDEREKAGHIERLTPLLPQKISIETNPYRDKLIFQYISCEKREIALTGGIDGKRGVACLNCRDAYGQLGEGVEQVLREYNLSITEDSILKELMNEMDENTKVDVLLELFEIVKKYLTK
jgi:hypothetical protein